MSELYVISSNESISGGVLAGSLHATCVRCVLVDGCVATGNSTVSPTEFGLIA